MTLPKHLRSEPVSDKARWTARTELVHLVEAVLSGDADLMTKALGSSIRFLEESR